MFGLGNNDDEERFWNFMMFRFYGTDKELEKSSPVIIILAVITIIGVIIWANWP
jgi:hypothetical protein